MSIIRNISDFIRGIMFKYLASSFVIMSSAMHLFCCGIPLLLSMTSLATTLGISSGSFLEVEWFETIEKELIVISGVILAITIIAHIVSQKLNCYENAKCNHEPCDDKKSTSTYLLMGASLLYVVNVITIMLE